MHSKRALAPARHVVISVEDDGPGLSPETAVRIFKRGFRSKPGAGRGLGFDSIVQAMARVGGSVQSRSLSLGGAAFELWLFAST